MLPQARERGSVGRRSLAPAAGREKGVSIKDPRPRRPTQPHGCFQRVPLRQYAEPSLMSNTTAVTEELKKALAAEEGGRRWLRRLAFAAALALVIGAGLTWSAKHRPLPPPRFVTAFVAIGDVVEKVQATGTVQPLLQVSVGAQVNGRVTQVL